MGTIAADAERAEAERLARYERQLDRLIEQVGGYDDSDLWYDPKPCLARIRELASIWEARRRLLKSVGRWPR